MNRSVQLIFHTPLYHAGARIIAAFFSIGAIAACSGGSPAAPAPVLAGPGGQVAGGGVGATVSGVNMTHDQAASAFLSALQTENSYSMAKIETLESGYAVLQTGNSFTAVYIDGWTGSDPATYISNSGSSFGVTSLGNGNYQSSTGILFAASQPSSKDLEKVAAFKEKLQLSGAAKALENFGFSEERSLEVASLASELAKAPRGSLTDQDYDNFSLQITGTTMTKIKIAVAQKIKGDGSQLNKIIETAAQTNGVGSEQMKQMLGHVVGKSL